MERENNITYRIKGDRVIWIIIFFLSMVSLAAVYSSGNSLAFKESKNAISILLSQANYLVISLTTLYICYRLPLVFWRIISKWGMYAIIALLFATIIAGKSINYAQRWISIFGFKFQPSEFAKVGIVLYLSWVLENTQLDSFKKFFKKILIPVALTIAPILYGSIATGLLVSLVVFIMMVVAGIKWKYLLNSAAIAIVTLSIVILINLTTGFIPRLDTAVSRITTFTKTEEADENLTIQERQKLRDKRFQADMARVAITSVDVLGKGPGNSTQRNFLPHPYSDFIYAIIIEEWGFIGGLLILMLYLWFLGRCVMIAQQCTTIFSAMTVIGLATLITAQAFLHMLVNVGILPVTGHTLPLVSRGGTSLIAIGGAFGIILSVSRTIDRRKVKGEVEI